MILAKLDDDSYAFHLEAIFEMIIRGLSDNSGIAEFTFAEGENEMSLCISKGGRILYNGTVEFKSKRRAIELFIMDCSKLLLR